MDRKLMVLIPAYNESGNITRLIDGVKHHIPDADILVVNDCSTDGTAQIVTGLEGIGLLNLPFNMGIGGAVLSGFKYFIDNDYDVLVRLDGDGQHPPEVAGKLIDPVISGIQDVVIGSRYLDAEAAYSSPIRKLGIKFLNLLTAMILRRRMTDSTSGFRAYNRAAIEYLVRDYPFDYPEPEEIYLLTRGGFRLREVPVVMREREQGVSSINMFRTYYFLIKILITILVKHSIGGQKK
jgi:glycosyltransferase involved in cell wall biosynthesis